LNTVEWNNLTSGLVGAVIGAIAGFVGSVLLNWRTTRQTQRAAARAVLAEMFTNADRALSAESTLVFHEFLDGAWRTQLPLVAELLRWPDLKILVNAYDSAARAYENARGELPMIERETQIVGSAFSVQRRREKVCSWFLAVADEWVKAMRLLRPSAIRRRERGGFDGDIQKIEQRLNSAKALYAQDKFA